MTPDEAAIERMATTIREEIVRQYRENERQKCPGGSAFYEEAVAPRQIACAVLAALIADPPPAVERAVLERLIVRAADWPAYLWTDKGQHKGEGAREFLHERLAELAREESDGRY